MLNKQQNMGLRNAAFYDSRILVVDDAALNRELIVSYLESGGFKNLETAEDGNDALEKIESFFPDIMILDLMMPGMDGIQVIKSVRNNPKIRHLPIIVQTALSEPEQRIEAWQCGANDVVAKPIHRLELLSRIKVQLENAIFLRELEDYHTIAQQDIDQAFEVQKSLLPSAESIAELENRHNIKIGSLFVPSRFLSGDLWGILDIGPTQLAIWICDFSGKGIRAALHTFRLHTLIQEFKHCADDPGELIDALNNRLISVMPPGQFSTFLVGVIDFQANLFTYTSASATHPLIYFPAEKRFQVGDGTGMPLGVVERQSYPLRTMTVPKGASLVLYSDLLWEPKALPGVFLDEENLASFARELNGEGVVQTVGQQVRLLGDPSFSDDLTLIEVTRLSSGNIEDGHKR
ncbi:MAG: transcriptional regulator [Alphaproteobacteria bacterium]|jgi:sigma-B regulation protein RsbU (phosphoserine phosphatase)|nr:transcriptional regulator [Alphaproteobacteria bacterium]